MLGHRVLGAVEAVEDQLADAGFPVRGRRRQNRLTDGVGRWMGVGVEGRRRVPRIAGPPADGQGDALVIRVPA